MRLGTFLRAALFAVFFVIIGAIIGGYLLAGVQRRAFLAPEACKDSCWEESKILGLMGSIVMQKSPSLLRAMVYETERSVAIKHPRPQAPVHYVIIPKKDIKDAGEITAGDEAYLVDAYAVMRMLIEKEGLIYYKILTNGPGFQEVNYLHFHLFGRKSDSPLPAGGG